jgi:hypothetical protein
LSKSNEKVPAKIWNRASIGAMLFFRQVSMMENMVTKRSPPSLTLDAPAIMEFKILLE